jgi:DnaJ-domain-containing protein 1
MKLFERLFRSKDRTPHLEPALPPRPEVLQQPEIDPDVLKQALHVGVDTHNEEEDGTCDERAADRYSPRPSWEEGGPKWDPYAREQSRAAKLQSARRSRARPGERLQYDRWALQPDKPPKLTHYQVLGVQPDAPIEQIERAYRRYAATVHPDKFFDNPNARAHAEGQLRELNGIMQILRDPAKRARYDNSI